MLALTMVIGLVLGAAAFAVMLWIVLVVLDGCSAMLQDALPGNKKEETDDDRY